MVAAKRSTRTRPWANRSASRRDQPKACERWHAYAPNMSGFAPTRQRRHESGSRETITESTSIVQDLSSPSERTCLAWNSRPASKPDVFLARDELIVVNGVPACERWRE